jgi:hypothetical protein
MRILTTTKTIHGICWTVLIAEEVRLIWLEGSNLAKEDEEAGTIF